MIALTHAAEGDSPAAAERLSRAKTAGPRVIDPYMALLVEILRDRARVLVATKSADTNFAAWEYLSLAARSHVDHALQKALALMT